MRSIARQLVTEELDRNDSSDHPGRAAVRVCAKLSKSISALTGARGFRSLLARALKLAAAEVPWLSELSIGLDGALVIPAELKAQLTRGEVAKGAVTLVTHLLELLATFIGEALTLRLVQQVWPKAALNPESKGKV